MSVSLDSDVTRTGQDPQPEEVPSSASDARATTGSRTIASSRSGTASGRLVDSSKSRRAESASTRPPSRIYTGGGAGNPEPRPGTGARVVTGTNQEGGMERLDDGVAANPDLDDDEQIDDGAAGSGGEGHSAVDIEVVDNEVVDNVLQPPRIDDMPSEEVEADEGSTDEEGEDEFEKAEVLLPPTFPWKHVAASWFGKESENAHAVYAVFRDHYLKTEGIVFDQREWENLLCQNQVPFKNARAESMVQLMVGLLARKKTKKRLADDKSLFAAALRTRHGENHFEKMATLMEKYLDEMDDGPLNVEFLVSLGKRVTAQFAKTKGGKDGALSPFPSSFAIAQALEEADMTTGAAYTDKNGYLFKYGGKERIDHLIPEYELPPSIANDFDFDQFDHNPVGAFLAIVAQRRLRLLDMFRMLDRNRDGTVSKREAFKSLQMLKMPLTEQRLQNFIDAMDTDGDGKIGWKEMVKARVVHLLSLRKRGSLLEKRDKSAARAGSSRLARSDPNEPVRQASGRSIKTSSDLGIMRKDLLDEYESGATIDDGAREALLLLNNLESEGGAGAQDRVKVAGTGMSVNMETLTELALVCHYATRP